MLKTERTNRGLMLSMFFVAAIFFLAGCAAKKTLAESPETGLTLSYKLPAEQGIYYTSESDIKQSMEMQGQSIDADIKQVMAFDLRPVSFSEGKLTLEITLDTMGMSVKSPMVSISADASKVLGKSFNMEISDKGEELDLTGAESIQYSIAQAGNRSIVSNFQKFFPDLPGQKIIIGESWSDIDTITEITETEEVVMILESKNTFEGMENVTGYECVKIVSQITGPRTGEQNAQGVTLVSKGDVEGTITWYFAYQEGIYVKSVMVSSVKSMVSATGAQNLSFPMNIEIQSIVEISKK